MARPTPPLSPHLSVYRLQITMAMSVFHRMTGIILYFGMLLIVIWLGAATMGDGPLGFVNWLAGTWIGQIVLIGLTWSLYHHLLGGIRHFVWDVGAGFSETARFGMAWATLIGGGVLTALTWIFFVWL